MILFISLLAATALQPASPDWREINSNSERQLSWDANGVTRNGETATVRLRWVMIPARQGANAYAISRVEIRCAAGQARVVETTNYSADGTAGQRDATALPFETIPPNSIVATIHSQICTQAGGAH